MNFTQISNLVGGLGVFLFGMKLMSESLQHAAGDRLKSLLSKMTSNKFSSVLSGLAITATIQSSSATTVMVVGFVNAGLLTLTQAIGVVMGANIGTTITAWLVALLGFKVKISLFALPMISVGVALLFARRDKLNSWGNALIGFGLLFLGLNFLKASVPDVTKHPETFQFLSQYAGQGALSTLIFIGIGTLITVIIQSSSATMTITITLAYMGHIPYDAAIAMVLGENIGTTITANLAAIAGNRNAKKAAFAHTIFNVLGVIWILLLLSPILSLIKFFIPGDPMIDSQSTRFHISSFHTLFNILNTLILVWFIPQIEKVVSFIWERKIDTDKGVLEKSEFKLLSGGSVKISEFAVIELNKYTKQIMKTAFDNLAVIKKLINGKFDAKKVEIIGENERKLDEFRNQALSYLTEIQATGVTGQRAKNILLMADRVKIMEEIGDLFLKIARKIKNAGKNYFKGEEKKRDVLLKQMKIIEDQYSLIINNLDEEKLAAIANLSENLKKKVRKHYDDMTKRVQKEKANKKSKLLTILLFLDLSRYMDDLSNFIHQIAVSERST